jgi:hypothetical protein
LWEVNHDLWLNGDRIGAMLHVPRNSDGFNDEARDRLQIATLVGACKSDFE